jgi:hypothetical protein
MRVKTTLHFDDDVLLRARHKCLDMHITLSDYVKQLIISDLENENNEND